ncbi:MAG: replicative DNA helicase [Spirochaetaceae bacterium]|nr:replicative DNA helicase [Spirochaetaceae bacterium]MBQ7904301.1 replicative DNA helicase [Spirochaetaceae bacterium]
MSVSQLKDKVPPHNLDAEQATLGALLLDWDSISVVIQYLRPDGFYSLQNQKIFSAMLDLYNEGRQGDLISLKEKLKEKGDLEAAGGIAYISELTDRVPTSANVDYYAQIVKDQSIRRELIKSAAKIVSKAHDDTIESRGVLEEAQKEIFNLTDNTASHEFKTTQELVTQVINRIQTVYKNKTSLTGIESGFTDLDQMTAGFQPSEMIILGARPSIGKTAMALSMIQHIAIQKKIPSAFFSLEMSDVQVMQRLFVQESRISSEKLRTGFLSHNDFQALQDAAGKIYDSPLYIVDTPNMKLLDLRSVARRLKSQNDIKIIFIDYITLIGSENTQIPRHEQVAEISRSLKSLARELDIPIVVLSQVARSTEGKAPTLAELRESGSIEQDADVVMFLHRERSPENKGDTIPTELIVAKQRNGPVGSVDITFIPHFTKFENVSHQKEER